MQKYLIHTENYFFSNQKTQATALSVQQQVTLRSFKKKYI